MLSDVRSKWSGHTDRPAYAIPANGVPAFAAASGSAGEYLDIAKWRTTPLPASCSMLVPGGVADHGVEPAARVGVLPLFPHPGKGRFPVQKGLAVGDGSGVVPEGCEFGSAAQCVVRRWRIVPLAGRRLRTHAAGRRLKTRATGRRLRTRAAGRRLQTCAAGRCCCQ